MQQTNTQIPGIPLGLKAVGYRQVKYGEYNMVSDGRVCKYTISGSSSDLCLIVEPDNVYNAIDLKQVPLPEGWEHDGDKDKPETWYREITMSHPNGRSGLCTADGETVLGFNGCAYSEKYSIEYTGRRYRIFLRRVKPNNVYGTNDLTTLPLPAGYERDGKTEAEYHRIPASDDQVLTIGRNSSGLPDWRRGWSHTSQFGATAKAVVLRAIPPIPPRMKNVIVIECDAPAPCFSAGAKCDGGIDISPVINHHGHSLTVTSSRVEKRPV